MKKVSTFAHGKMAEWSNAAVLKTVDLHGSGGSNPSLSAKPCTKETFVLLQGLFLFIHFLYTVFNVFVATACKIDDVPFVAKKTLLTISYIYIVEKKSYICTSLQSCNRNVIY